MSGDIAQRAAEACNRLHALALLVDAAESVGPDLIKAINTERDRAEDLYWQQGMDDQTWELIAAGLRQLNTSIAAARLRSRRREAVATAPLVIERLQAPNDLTVEELDKLEELVRAIRRRVRT